MVKNLKSEIVNRKSPYAIIVAGGSGTRMGTAVPKQFLSVNGLPVLMHTLLAFYNAAAKPKLIFSAAYRFSRLLETVMRYAQL